MTMSSCPLSEYDLANFVNDFPVLYPPYFLPSFAIICDLSVAEAKDFEVEMKAQSGISFSRSWRIRCNGVSRSDIQRASNSKQSRPHVEQAAICIVAVIFFKETALRIDEVTEHGSYVDHHLVDETGRDCGVIEVGGTSNSRPSAIKSSKKKQASKSTVTPCFIGVAAFGGSQVLIETIR